MNNIPNFDGMTKEELVEFFLRYNKPTRKEAEELVGKVEGYTKTTKNLAMYAWNKSTAMNYRETGHIQLAQHYEGICERIYKTLSDDIKW